MTSLERALRRGGLLPALALTLATAGCGGGGGDGGADGGADAGGGDARMDECRLASDCPDERPFCDDGRCVTCRVDSDCGELLELCVDGACEMQDCDLTEAEIRERCGESGRFCQTLTNFDCAEESCVFGPRDCDDGDPCTADRCDEAAMACMHPFDPPVDDETGASCDNGEDDDCDGLTDMEEVSCGGCAMDADCDDGNVCTDDLCVDNACQNTPVTTSTDCNDGDECTVADRCEDGTCTGDILDEDGDGYGSMECGGTDCDDADDTLSPGLLEEPGASCSDGVDNDCDMRADALDYGCHPLCLRGWCWDKPLIHGWDVTDAAAVDGSEVWLVARAGVTMRWDGSEWSAHDAGTAADLHGAWASPSGDVWAVGDGGTVVRWDGASWTAETTAPGGDDLRSVHGTGDTDVWVGGQDGYVRRWDGSSWEDRAITVGTPGDVRALAVDSTGRAWAADGSALYSYDAGAWSPVTGPASVAQLERIADDDVWATTSGLPWHYDGSDWAEASAAPDEALGVWAAAADDVWMVTRDSFVGTNAAHRYDGASWSSVETSLGDAVHIGGLGADDVWFAGSEGRMHWWNGSSLERLVDTLPPSLGGSERKLLSVSALAEDAAWVTGEYGTIFRWDGLGWSAMPENINASNTSDVEDGNFELWGTAADDLYLVGGNQYPARSNGYGFLEHWNGTEWTVLGSRTSLVLRAVWGSAPDDLWIAASASTFASSSNAVLRWNGSELVDVDVGDVPGGLHDVAGSSGGDVWLIGREELLRVEDGTGTIETLPCGPLSLEAIAVTAPGEVWVAANTRSDSSCAADGGILLRRSGGSWSVELDGTDLAGSLQDLWAGAGDDVWVLGETELRHWNGSSWTVTPRGGVGMTGIGGVADGPVWGIGRPRRILRRR